MGAVLFFPPFAYFDVEMYIFCASGGRYVEGCPARAAPSQVPPVACTEGGGGGVDNLREFSKFGLHPYRLAFNQWYRVTSYLRQHDKCNAGQNNCRTPSMMA